MVADESGFVGTLEEYVEFVAKVQAAYLDVLARMLTRHYDQQAVDILLARLAQEVDTEAEKVRDQPGIELRLRDHHSTLRQFVEFHRSRPSSF